MSDTNQVQTFEENIKLARLVLMRKPNFAFFSSILYKMSFIEAGDSVTKTIALDANNLDIYINVQWFNQQSHEHQATALAHEVLHYALMHDQRLGKKDPYLFQEACDQVVNNILDEYKFQLPHGTKKPKKRFQQQPVEEVYKYMVDERDAENPDSNGKDPSQNPDPLGNDLNFQPPPPQNQQNKRKSILNQAKTANDLTQKSGSEGMSSVLENFFKEMNEGKLNWKVVLEEHLNEITAGERSFHMFERRYLPMDLYIPVNESRGKLGKAAMAFDVSGSVSDEEIVAFIREINKIKSDLNPETLEITTFNTGIVEQFSISEDENIHDIKMNTGGGTDLHPVFDYYNDPKNEPQFLIVFSDLYCRQIEEETKYPVIWVCINNERANVNFGKLIHITSEELIDEQ